MGYFWGLIFASPKIGLASHPPFFLGGGGLLEALGIFLILIFATIRSSLSLEIQSMTPLPGFPVSNELNNWNNCQIVLAHNGCPSNLFESTNKIIFQFLRRKDTLNVEKN